MSLSKKLLPIRSACYRPISLPSAGARVQTITMASATQFYDFVPKTSTNEDFKLSDLRNKVVLVVNVASKCGFTPQYAGLETLYQTLSKQYPDQFMILGFPCNQFGWQEPGSNEEIQIFCSTKWSVSFPVLGKVDVNGDKAEPLYEWMKSQKSSMGLKVIKWNFEKFLIGRSGQVIERWSSKAEPASLEQAIRAELEKKNA